MSRDEPESPIPLAKHRQVLERTVLHIDSVFVNVGVPFVDEKTGYGMTVCFIQFAHDLYLVRYFPCRFLSPPCISRV